MNSLRCSNCSFLNFATASACKRCGFQFQPPAVNDWAHHPDATQSAYPQSAYPQSAQNDSYYWDQPSYPPPYAPLPVQSGSGKGKAVAGLVVFAVSALIAFIAIPKFLKMGKTNFANVSMNEYKSPDKKFSISLPGTPKETVIYQQTPLGKTPVTVLEARVGNDGGCLLMHADYPLGENKISEDQIYEYVFSKQGGLSRGYEMGRKSYITHGGYRGLEIELKSSAGSRRNEIGVARLFWVSPRMYVLLSMGPDTADYRAFQPKCQESFKLY